MWCSSFHPIDGRSRRCDGCQGAGVATGVQHVEDVLKHMNSWDKGFSYHVIEEYFVFGVEVRLTEDDG